MSERMWVRIWIVCALILSACGAPVDHGRTEDLGTVAEALGGTVTLTAGSFTSSGYDFSTQTFKGQSGGDFYFTQGAFWSNNPPQRGVVKVGTCASVDSVTKMPTTGYTLPA